ncbi:MAG: esterase-like activity of phytase family protein, partial [Candidatus Bipolaricaulota bacterium]|nr:esterase-like activity of phytase family protein [Candidatus Bipolaricaulota bacterium]
DLDTSGLHSVDVVSVVQLKTPYGNPYAAGSIDPEDVLWAPTGFIVCSERDQDNNPWIRQFSHDGTFLSEIPVPEEFVPSSDGNTQVRGTRTNLSLEASTLTPDYATLYVMNEEALVQDGDVATPMAGTPVRLIKYDLSSGTPVEKAEYVYITEPMFAAPPEGKSGDNGVPGMVYVGHITAQFDLIVMERSYVSGAGNQIGLFGVKFDDSSNVMGIPALADPANPQTISVLEKTPLLIISDNKDLTQVDFDPDNMEAISLGPQLPNGNYTLIIASDNNFNPKYQRNVFAAFEIVPDK